MVPPAHRVDRFHGFTVDPLRRRLPGAAVGALLAGVSTPGAAQPPPLEEIIVTAERRETALQQTPLSVAAFTAETMELKGLETIEDIATVTPNLDIKGARGAGNVSPTWQIRGLAGGRGDIGERAAALYIDGIYMSRTTGPYMNIMDIERIEVLRGPQGTLFGRNSIGGAIRVFSTQPQPEFEGYVRLTAGDYARRDVSAMVNVPLGDSVFFRAQGGALTQDGYVTRGTQELGGADDTLARLQLAIEPSEELRVTLGLSSADSESSNPQELATFDMNPDLNYEGNRADWVSDFLEAAGQPRITPNNDPRIVLDDYTMPDWCFLDDANPDWDAACERLNESEYAQFDANVALDLTDRWTFASITGSSEFESNSVSDLILLGSDAARWHIGSDVVYQELQLNATFDRLDLVTGISYFQEDISTNGESYDRRGSSVFPATAAGNTVAPGGLGPNGLFVTGATEHFQRARSIGLFANLTWRITERLNLTPGMRWADDRKKVTQTRYLANDFIPFAGLPSQIVFAEEQWSNTDYRLTLDYRLTADHMIYATVSESYRPGAYNYSMPTNAAAQSLSSGDAQTAATAAGLLAAFTPPDKLQNDEIGLRSQWLDGRLRVNLTYFDMAHADRQGAIQILDPASSTGFRLQLVNTGEVDLSGYELEGQIAATGNLTFDFSAGLLDSTVKNPCANNGDFLVPGPVEDSYSLGGRWFVPLDRGSNLTFALSYAYTGRQQTAAGGTVRACFDPITGLPNPVPGWGFDSRYEMQGYSLVHGRVRYASVGGDWELTVFGNNLTDEVYGTHATRIGGPFWDALNPAAGGGIAAPERSALGFTRGRPREVGVSFQYNFGAKQGS